MTAGLFPSRVGGPSARPPRMIPSHHERTIILDVPSCHAQLPCPDAASITKAEIIAIASWTVCYPSHYNESRYVARVFVKVLESARRVGPYRVAEPGAHFSVRKQLQRMLFEEELVWRVLIALEPLEFDNPEFVSNRACDSEDGQEVSARDES